MRNRHIVISAIKIQGVVQIPSETMLYSLLESTVASVSGSGMLGEWLFPSLCGLGPGCSGVSLWRNLRDKHIENETPFIGREQQTKAPVRRQFEGIIMPEEWVLR